ncbi:hypothetical protein ACH5RR_026823 [Cinchona calisaya]|uniref:Reverse transcriptase zinc-binding domain-containing protein n=1 Tax=Cinchona calisaya TaxID=153742 RepID=A0ABD2Z5K2_9GENT
MEDGNDQWVEELAVREAGTTVEWWKIVWYKRHVPRATFVMWLLCKRRLMTKDRMKAWGIQVNTMCVLCRQQEESMEHHFLECSITSRIWQKIQKLCLVYRWSYPYSAELSWIFRHVHRTKFAVELCYLALSISMYCGRRRRNEVIFQGKNINVVEIVQQIVQ